jgi:hypothetical protein
LEIVVAEAYTRVHSLDRKYKKLRSRITFYPWEWYCARSEIRANNFEIDREAKTIVTPRIRKLKTLYEQSMEDIYQDSLSYVREATERDVTGLTAREKDFLATFIRQLAFADGEPPLRNSLKNLQDCQGAIVQSLTNLQQHTLNLRDLFLYGFKSYELRTGKYVGLLSRRLQQNLWQPYGETDFRKILQIREEAQELELRIAEYGERIEDEQKDFLERSRVINQNDDAARARIGLDPRDYGTE